LFVKKKKNARHMHCPQWNAAVAAAHHAMAALGLRAVRKPP